MHALLMSVLLACSGPESTAASAAKASTPPASSPAAAPAPAAKTSASLPEGANAALLDPSLATETAPASYKARFDTTKGEFVVEVTRDWAPVGADRFYNLVKIGFFDDVAFFRVVDGFMVQFGLSGYPQVNSKWRPAKIKDDPVTQKNTRAMVTFATSGPDSRTTQVFINFVDENVKLDSMGFAPFGTVVTGMDVVDTLYKGYGEGAPRGKGPSQGRIQSEGNTYLKASFDKLDYVKKASIVTD